jgi:hypothetical protein
LKRNLKLGDKRVKIQIKKTIAVLLVLFLATMLLVSMASAKTAIKDLPTKKEVLTFVRGYQYEDGFVGTVSADSEYYHPEWTWDTWKDQYGFKYISFYYKINSHKYGSIYFDSEGDRISDFSGLKLKLIKSYKGN